MQIMSTSVKTGNVSMRLGATGVSVKWASIPLRTVKPAKVRATFSLLHFYGTRDLTLNFARGERFGQKRDVLQASTCSVNQLKNPFHKTDLVLSILLSRGVAALMVFFGRRHCIKLILKYLSWVHLVKKEL